MFKILEYIFYLLTSVIKPSRVIVFSSYPAFTDNAYAVYKHLLEKNLFRGYKFVWVTLEKNINIEILGNTNERDIRVFSKKSILSLWYYFNAKHIFITHGLYSRLTFNRPNTVINLWHGMPLKRIGILDKKSSFYMKNTQLLIATSVTFQKIMAKSFNKHINQVLLTGQPRNDLMFEPTDFYKKTNLNKANYRKVGIWLPTYRKTSIGKVRVDGNFQDGFLSFLNISQLQEMNLFFKSCYTLIIIKLHPMDILQDFEFENYSNIRIIKQKDFTSQLYPLLGSTDFLLTDYSSVWVDYEILNKPIGFVMDDFDEYKNNRGFTIDNFENELPGIRISDIATLKKFILNPFKHKVSIGNGNKYNEFKDNKSTERLISYLNKKNL